MRVAKMTTTDVQGRENSMSSVAVIWNIPVWKVRSMLIRLSPAATTPTVATVTNFPATICPAGTGAVRSVSSVPLSFSPAARSMAG